MLGYAKYETFPVWNLPLHHPVNVAYEAATADLEDVNIIDPFHLEAYNIKAVNYNRDISTFPILKSILSKLMNKDIYNSPTDMGVNMVADSIIDDDEVQKEATMEVVRRYYNSLCDVKKDRGNPAVIDRIEVLMNALNITKEYRKVVEFANKIAEDLDKNVIAVELENGKIVTGKESDILSATSAVFLNVIKEYSNIPDDVYLLSPTILEAIFKMKQKTSYKRNYCLNIQEVLIALSICSGTNPSIEKAMSNLNKLRGLEAHSSYIVESDEINVIKNLGINLTCEPKFVN